MAGDAPHIPVLLEEVRRLAAVRPGERWADLTLGFGGHSEALLEAGADVVGVDQDPQALSAATSRLSPFGERFRFVHANFRDVAEVFAEGTLDGVLADLGVSSWQLDRAERGFSFGAAGPVDMRMNPLGAETALELLRRLEVGEVASLLRTYGEEPFAGPIARALKAFADGEGPHDTRALAAVVVAAIPRRVAAGLGHHPATRTFQALRIAVNDELGALEALLAALPALLGPGGRALIISFHSLEDRMVKQAFGRWAGRDRPQAPRRGLPPPPSPEPTFELLTPRPVVATPAETARNPRARSAKLRAARKLAGAR